MAGLLLNYLDSSTEGKLSVVMNYALKSTSFAEHAYALRASNQRLIYRPYGTAATERPLRTHEVHNLACLL